MSLTDVPVTPSPNGAGLFVAHRTRDLLGLEGTPPETILELLDEAREWRERTRRRELPCERLRGVSVCLAFFEDSTRTRVSFELAARRLGATCVSFGAGGSSVSKGETLLDTLAVIEAMRVDLIVIRHASSGAPRHLAGRLEAGIVNAGDGMHEHPTQGLLDLMTLRDAWAGRFEGRRLAIVGDVAHSRVARSAIHGLTALGASVTVCGPPTLMPSDVEALGAEMAPSVEEALAGADGVMALRLQKERMDSGLLPSLGEYARRWGVTAPRVALMKPEAPVLHPGPMNRNVEIASDVADGPRSVILDQVENGVAVRCAVLARCADARVREAA